MRKFRRNLGVIEKNPAHLAFAWLVPAVGAAILVTIRCLSYLHAYVASGGKMEAITFGPTRLWIVSLYAGAWILPPLPTDV
jgi:hypothetical protein